MDRNWYLSFQLPMSKPYIADEDCLKNIEINDLQAKEFHVFEDGVEQKISTVVLEHVPWTLERDVHTEPPADPIPQHEFVELHKIWSYTPRGIWRSADLTHSWRFSSSSSYRISYVPQRLQAGKCHRVKVTVDRPHAEVIATNQYCYVPHASSDALAETDLGRSMAAELTLHFIDPEIPLSARAGFFYSDPHTAKVNIVLDFPPEKLKRHWSNGDLHGNIGVMGAAYAPDGSQVARFSDAAIMRGDLYWSDKESDVLGNLPSRYETQLDLPAGHYQLRIVLSDGIKFGRIVFPITVGEQGQEELTLSSLFLFKRFRNADVAAQEAQKINLAPAYVPLASQNIVITPTADPTFHLKQTIPVYFEVYKPPAQTPQVKVVVHMRIVDPKSGNVKQTFPWFDAEPYRRAGTDKLAIHRFLVCGELSEGKYRLEVQARDSAGRITTWRGAEFNVAAQQPAVAVTAQQSGALPATPPDAKPPDSANAPSPMLLKVEQFKIYTRGDSYVYEGDPNYPEGRRVTAENSIVTERSTVLIGQDSSVTWTTYNREDDLTHAHSCTTVRSYNSVLPADQMQKLKSIIDKDTFTHIDRRNLTLEGSATGGTQGVLYISRGDHVQALAFGSGRRSKAAKRVADAKDQEKIDKDIQEVLHWIGDQVQKPHKNQLRKTSDGCKPS